MNTLRIVKPTNETKPGESPEELLNYFTYNCGVRRLPWMLEEVKGWLAEGFDPWVIREAMRRTSRAPRPSWAYLAAIMHNASCCHFYDCESFTFNQHTNSDWDLPL